MVKSFRPDLNIIFLEKSGLGRSENFSVHFLYFYQRLTSVKADKGYSITGWEDKSYVNKISIYLIYDTIIGTLT